MKAKVIVSVAVLGIIAAVGGWWAYRDYQQRRAIELLQFAFSPTEKPSWRRHLPATATDIHEWAWADGFLPDYSYFLKARIAEAEFQQFVARLGLTPHTSDRKYSEHSNWLSWSSAPGFDGDWWDASPSLASTFVSEGHDTWTFAKYENGFLYFVSLNH